MRPVLLTGFVKYNKALSVVVMQRITRFPGATMGYIECTQDCRLTARYFTESIYRGKLIVLGVCTMAPCYGEKKKKKEGKEEINATYGVIVRVIALLFSFNFLPRLFPTRPDRILSTEGRERERFFHDRERGRRERQEKCDRDEIICEFGLCRW